MVKQPLSQFDAPGHAAGEGFNQVASTIRQAYARENLPNAVPEHSAVQTVEMTLMPEIFVSRQFPVDTRGLKDNPDLTAETGRVTGNVEAHDERSASTGDHESR